jgi:hypothetical protein
VEAVPGNELADLNVIDVAIFHLCVWRTVLMSEVVTDCFFCVPLKEAGQVWAYLKSD